MGSPVAGLSFKGAFAGGVTPGVAGDVSVSVPSLRALARLIGFTAPAYLAGDDLTIAATLKASPHEAALAEATMTSANQTVQGALHFAEGAGARPTLSGTLDADRLALAPLIGPAESLFDATGDWSDRAFALTPPQDFDLDLRLSAAQLDVYGRELARAAGSLILKDGALTASLLDAGLYGGRLQGEARIASVGQDLDLHVRGGVSDADFGAAFSDIGWPVPGGKGAAEFALQTVGRTPAAAVAGLSGSVSVRLQQGSVAGVNLEEALRRSQRRRIDVARDLQIGGTAFDKLALEFALGQGVLHVVNGELAALFRCRT
jgi:AsmA protein